MAIVTPFGHPIQFYVGTSVQFESLAQKDPKSFYLILGTDNKFRLFIGENAIISDVNIEGILNSDTNALSQAISAATEVIKVEKADTDDDMLEVGKFYYYADTINGAQSLKFRFSPEAPYELLPTNTYDATSDRAMSGKAVAQAVASASGGIVETEELPTNPEVGKFYLVINEDGTKLIFQLSETEQLVLSDQVPINHASADNKYGLATADMYGHAKSGVNKNSEDNVLLESFVINPTKDNDLQGDITDRFARVNHKHKMPNAAEVVNATDSASKITAAQGLLGEDTYNFIAPGEDGYKKNDENKVIPINERIIIIERDLYEDKKFIESNSGTPQNITNVVIGDTLTVNNIEAAKEEDGTDGTISIGGSINVSGDIHADGVISSTSGIVTDGNIAAPVGIFIKLTAGNTTLGSTTDFTKSAMTITAPNADAENGSIICIAPISGDEATFSSLTSSVINGTNIMANNFLLNSKEFSFVESGVAVEGFTKRLAVDDNGLLYVKDLEVGGLLDTRINSAIQGSAISASDKKGYTKDNPLTDQWNINDNTSIPTIQLVSKYLTENYVSANDLNNRGYITSAALSGYLQNVFHIGTTAPTNTKLLWIDTSLGNGVIKYHNGTSWILTSAVWS